MKNVIIKKKDAPKIIKDYNDYISKCFTYLDSTEIYNKSEFTMKLQNIYNENNYKFALKENTIKNIIGRWKQNSLKFTKYNALEHRYNKNNELILWDYVNTIIYSSNKKKFKYKVKYNNKIEYIMIKLYFNYLYK